MWQWLTDYQTREEAESAIIAEASNRLDVGEFQFFQLSYEHWYGKKPEPGRIEPHFFAYLMHDDPPPWARHFARRIIALDDGGELVGEDPIYHGYDRELRTPSKWVGWSVVGATLAVVLGFLWLIMASEELAPIARCVFPPCP